MKANKNERDAQNIWMVRKLLFTTEHFNLNYESNSKRIKWERVIENIIQFWNAKIVKYVFTYKTGLPHELSKIIVTY